MAVFLVCEGPKNGLDNRVLDALVIQYHALGVQIEPAGGSGSLGCVRAYLLNQPRHHSAISVEDRDYYSTQAQAHAGWGNPAANSYTWRRHEIENYLLHARVVLARISMIFVPQGLGGPLHFPLLRPMFSPCSRQWRHHCSKTTRLRC